MKILVACEYSGLVRDAFIAQGHEAVSADLLPTESPGPHYRGDVRNILDRGFDIMVAFPPCTYLCAAGARYWDRPDWEGKQEAALDFVRELMEAPIEKKAIENPRGIIGSTIRVPDQIIQPYQFGDPWRKMTCLWLDGLPPLKPTEHVEEHSSWIDSIPTYRNRGKNRSRTFPGVAKAMAEQWGVEQPQWEGFAS